MQDDSNMDGILAKIETKAELYQTGKDNLGVRTWSLVLVFFFTQTVFLLCSQESINLQ